MTERVRLVVFACAAAVLAAVLVAAFLDLPRSGQFAGTYGEMLDHVATIERQTTDVVTAVNFDYRGVDTMGEEFILFASASGVVLLLRMHPRERSSKGTKHDEGEHPARRVPPTSNAVRVLGLGLVGVCVVFGLYVVTHGQVSPGGGFQGGVVLAAAPMIAYLAGGAEVFARIAPERLVEGGEAVGAAGFVLIGSLGLAAGGAFLENVLPLGHWGSIASGGTIPLLNVSTGLEVAGGFVVAAAAFLEEVLKVERSGGRGDKR